MPPFRLPKSNAPVSGPSGTQLQPQSSSGAMGGPKKISPTPYVAPINTAKDGAAGPVTGPQNALRAAPGQQTSSQTTNNIPTVTGSGTSGIDNNILQNYLNGPANMGGGGGDTTPGPSPAAPPPNTHIDDINSLYNNMLTAEGDAWKQQQGLLQQQSNNLMRGAALTNARMGRGMGGGFASLQGSALGQGMNEMTKAGLAYDERRRGLEREQFDKVLDEKHRQEERGWQLEDKAAQTTQHNQDQQLALAQWWYEQTGEFPTSSDIANLYPSGQQAKDIADFDNSPEGQKLRSAVVDAAAKMNQYKAALDSYSGNGIMGAVQKANSPAYKAYEKAKKEWEAAQKALDDTRNSSGSK